MGLGKFKDLTYQISLIPFTDNYSGYMRTSNFRVPRVQGIMNRSANIKTKLGPSYDYHKRIINHCSSALKLLTTFPYSYSV